MRLRGTSLPRLLLAVASCLALAGCDQRPMHGTVLDPASAAPPLTLVAASGAQFTLAAEQGRTVILYFGYTHCPDVCPTTLGDWARARRALGADSAKVRFVFVAVDPGRDTPALAEAYAAQFDRAFTGLATSDAELQRVKRDWGIAVYPEGDTRSGEYSVAHPAHSFVVDTRGRLTLMVPAGVRGEDLAADLRRIR